jgi:hypothetical protein
VACSQLTPHQRLTERLRLIAESGVKPLLFGALLPVLLQGLALGGDLVGARSPPLAMPPDALADLARTLSRTTAAT